MVQSWFCRPAAKDCSTTTWILLFLGMRPIEAPSKSVNSTHCHMFQDPARGSKSPATRTAAQDLTPRLSLNPSGRRRTGPIFLSLRFESLSIGLQLLYLYLYRPPYALLLSHFTQNVLRNRVCSDYKAKWWSLGCPMLLSCNLIIPLESPCYF